MSKANRAAIRFGAERSSFHSFTQQMEENNMGIARRRALSS
jgi:hypothetical protein